MALSDLVLPEGATEIQKHVLKAAGKVNQAAFQIELFMLRLEEDLAAAPGGKAAVMADLGQADGQELCNFCVDSVAIRNALKPAGKADIDSPVLQVDVPT